MKGDEVWFSEVSPRPHDTGMVTLLSQNLSEFALHVRAILGLPVPLIETRRPGASYVILGEGQSNDITFSGVDKALESPDTEVRLLESPRSMENVGSVSHLPVLMMLKRPAKRPKRPPRQSMSRSSTRRSVHL